MFFKDYIQLTIAIASILFFTSCGTTYTAYTQMIEPPRSLPLIPKKQQISKELKDRKFEIRNVYFHPNNSLELIPIVPKRMYPKLLKQQLRKAFSRSHVNEGIVSPPYYVDVVIRDLQLKKSSFIIPGRSILLVRLELFRSNGKKVMRAEYEMMSVSKAIPVYVGGGAFLPVFVSSSDYNDELRAISELFPATAAVITKIVLGLQRGKDLSEIKVFQDVPMGNPTKLTETNFVLSDKPFGLTRLTKKDFEEANTLP